MQTATLIQKYIAEMDTGLPIGEPAGDENEGVVYTEKVMSYAFVAGQVIAQQDKVTLSTAYPDVAFISDKEAIQSFVMFANFQQSDLAVEFDENSHTFTMPNGSSVVFDYADKMILFSDYTTFTTPNGCVPFNPYGRTMPASCTLFQTQPSTQYFGGDPCVLTFDYNEVPMLQKNGDFLIPMQTFCDFFMNSLNYFVQYNGEATYMIPFNAEKNYPEFWQLYVDNTEKTEQISNALAQVNYYELCNILEARYGLRKAHDIDSFDAYFKRRGLKSEFLSGNVKRIENANITIGTLLFEDFHSGSNSTSPFFDGSEDSLDPVHIPIYDTVTDLDEEELNIKYANILAEYSPYLTVGTYYLETIVESNRSIYLEDKHQQRYGIRKSFDDLSEYINSDFNLEVIIEMSINRAEYRRVLMLLNEAFEEEQNENRINTPIQSLWKRVSCT